MNHMHIRLDASGGASAYGGEMPRTVAVASAKGR